MEVHGHEVITDPSIAVPRLMQDNFIAWDTETTGLSPWRDKLALMQFYGDQTGTLFLYQPPNGHVEDSVKSLFRRGPKLAAHNMVNFDLHFIRNAGISWEGLDLWDTLVAETVITSTGRRNVSVSLRASLKRRLGIEVDKNIEHTGWANELSPRQVEYACLDVLSIPALYREQVTKAEQTKQMQALLMEQELMPLFSTMTWNGMPLTWDSLNAYVREQQDIIRTVKTDLVDALGDINYRSVPQLKLALAKAGIDVPNTKEETLTDIAQMGGPTGALIEKLLTFRHANQRSNMYKEAWANTYLINDRVHPRFWQCSTDTNRVSCSDPNLQQVPKDGRKMFGNIDGLTMVKVDYSQIEVLVAASIAKDLVLLDRYGHDDMHRAVASSIFEKPEEEITGDERKMSKAISFTLLFGGGAQGLYDYARRGGATINLVQAEQLVNRFFSSFQGLARFKAYAQQQARLPGPAVIRLPNGLRRVLIAGVDKTATRILNTSVQGTACVGLKYGMLEANKRGLFKYMSATVHDELVAAVPDNEAKEYGKELMAAMLVGMQKVIHGATPRAELALGKSWPK